MPTITLTIPAGLTGDVQTEFGNYDITGDEVTVDSRVARQLVAYGFSSPDIPSSAYDNRSLIFMSVPNGYAGTVQGYPIVDGQVEVPITVAWSLIPAGFKAVSPGPGGDPLLGDFVAPEYLIYGQTSTFEDVFSSPEGSGQAAFVTAFGNTGGPLIPTPGVGLVIEAFDGDSGTVQANAFNPDFFSQLMAEDGFIMVLDVTITTGEPLGDPVSFNYELYGSLFRQDNFSGPTFGLWWDGDGSRFTLSDANTVYEEYPFEVPVDNLIRIAVLFKTDGTLAASVRGGTPESITASSVLTDPPEFFALSSTVYGTNADTRMVVDVINVFSAGSYTAEDLVGFSE